MQTILKIKNLTTGYQNRTMLENINLSIDKNDFLGIIGPNGGGKTTLIKTILSLQPVWKGTVELMIKKSEIGYLPQFQLFDKDFPISVQEVVLSGLLGKKHFAKSFNKQDRAKAEELMKKTDILHLKNKAIGKLSGGQIQRTLLCRSLINKPKLLILDEPGTFVDSKFENELFELLKELNKETAIVMVSHDVGIISSYVKSIACVNGTLHYHNSNKITAEQLAHYNCPIQLITHGEVPHRVLKNH